MSLFYTIKNLLNSFNKWSNQSSLIAKQSLITLEEIQKLSGLVKDLTSSSTSTALVTELQPIAMPKIDSLPIERVINHRVYQRARFHLLQRFMDYFSGKVDLEEVDILASNIKVYEIKKTSTISALLGPQGVSCRDSRLYLSQIFTLCANQAQGEMGPLLVNGKQNIFVFLNPPSSYYLKAFIVSCVYDSSSKQWFIDAEHNILGTQLMAESYLFIRD